VDLALVAAAADGTAAEETAAALAEVVVAGACWVHLLAVSEADLEGMATAAAVEVTEVAAVAAVMEAVAAVTEAEAAVTQAETETQAR
jgi:hypothetical protein